jgi:hypothetical protein
MILFFERPPQLHFSDSTLDSSYSVEANSLLTKMHQPYPVALRFFF